MTEKRFRYYEHKGADYILDTPNTSLDFIEMIGDALTSEEIVDLLNEQDTKIKKLEKSRDKWSALAENFSAFCDCYEKAINEVCDEETIEKIESKYAEYEEKVELK